MGFFAKIRFCENTKISSVRLSVFATFIHENTSKIITTVVRQAQSYRYDEMENIVSQNLFFYLK